MAGAALSALVDEAWSVMTAGTFVVEGQPMSRRTFDAMAGHGLASPTHRSRQARDWDLDDADIVVALAVEHVEWVRREYPTAAWKTATLARLVRDLPRRTVASLRLADVELEPSWEDVVDPGGGELPDFQRCAGEVVALVERLHAALAPAGP